MATLTIPFPVPSIELVWGPTLVGIFVGSMLYGVMATQCFRYYTHYPNDPTWIRLYVALLLLTDTVGTVLAIYWLYDLVIKNFLNLPAYGVANWMLAADPTIVGITGSLCQLFYAYRIQFLLKKPLVTALVVLVSSVGGISAILLGITVVETKFLTDFNSPAMQLYGSLFLAFAFTTDVLISGILTCQRKKKAGFNPKTDRLINRIIAATISNGAVTRQGRHLNMNGADLLLSFSTASLLFWSLLSSLAEYVDSPDLLNDPMVNSWQPDTGIHIGFSWVLGKLYTNSVLASLNSRRSNGRYSQEEGTSSAGARTFPNNRLELRPPKDDQNMIVHVSTEQHELVDTSYKWENGKGAGQNSVVYPAV
ncbi:hypothetical protein C8J57DRAFT_1731375 [Mycena rebaudengoi]|nr:hypothetical protein C8J57DRAFT_1731375 [Mycena rebaudengoi]